MSSFLQSVWSELEKANSVQYKDRSLILDKLLPGLQDANVDESDFDLSLRCLELAATLAESPSLDYEDQMEESCGKFSSSTHSRSLALCVVECITSTIPHKSEKLKLSKDQLRSLAKVFAIACEYLSSNVWGDETTRICAQQIVNLLCQKLFQAESLSRLLSETSESVQAYSLPFLIIRTYLAPKLGKKVWKINPAACAACGYIIQSTHPDRIRYDDDLLPLFMPYILNHLDDYRPDNKLRAIQALQHVLLGATSSQLAWTGYFDILYSALHNLLIGNISDASILAVALPCMLALLRKSLRDPRKTDRLRDDWTLYDTILLLIINAMATESKLAVRSALASNLPQYLKNAADTASKHVDRLLPILLEYLENTDHSSDESTRHFVLDSIITLLNCCFPSIQTVYTSHIARGLFKCLYECCTYSQDLHYTAYRTSVNMDRSLIERAYVSLKRKVIECLELLQKLDNEIVDASIHALKDTTGNLPDSFLESLSEISMQ